jgi:hypothetical protein
VSAGPGSYLAGVASLGAILGAVGCGGYWLRRWLAPSYGGALARLAELVLALALLTATLEALGSFGRLRAGWMVGACLLAGALATLLGRRRAPSRAEPSSPPPVPRWALALAIAAAAVAVGEWSFPSQLDLGRGIFSGDSTWYRLPFAIRFAQSHSTWHLLYTDPLALTAWFYPAGSELLGSVGILLFHSDWLSPLINIGWLALGLLAAYCIGRPFGVGPATLIGSALALDSGVLLLTQAGEARNDAMAIALLLAFAALLVSGYREGRAAPLVLAGLAGGLAVSVKLTMLAPVGGATLVAVAAIALRRRGSRAGGIAALLGAEALAGGYWYLRNFAHSGNPLPQVHRVGPIALPHPQQMSLYPRPPRSVAHYLFDPRIERVWFLPKLQEALGPLYPLILVLALLAAVWAVAALRSPPLAALGVAALLTAAVYLVTPLTAAGPPGQPHGFLTNTRYLMPALALALPLLPLAAPLRRGRRMRAATLCFLAAVLAVTVAATGDWESRFLPGSLLVAAALVLAPAAAGWLRAEGRIGRWLAAALALSMLVPAVALGREQEVRYLRDHYTIRALRAGEPGGPVRIFAWARRLRGRRIGLAGAGELFFDQALFAGAEDSNRVQYIGQPGPHGAFRVASSCPAFRRLVDRGRYDYLVITEFGDNSSDRGRFPLREWVRGSPALTPIRSERAYPQPVYAYRVTGELRPGGCPDR